MAFDGNIPKVLILRTLFATVSVIAVLTNASTALAQSGPTAASPDPIRPSIDGNSIDLFNGTYNAEGPSMTVGSTGSSLGYKSWNNGTGWADFTNPALILSGSTMTVSLSDGTDRFSVSGTTYTSTEGNGSTLTYNSTSRVYTYTNREGYIARFQGLPTGNQWIPNHSVATLIDITKPDGEILAYSYAVGHYCQIPQGSGCKILWYEYRVSGVVSNKGFKLLPVYVTDDTNLNAGNNVNDFFSIKSVQLFNLSTSSTIPVSSENITYEAPYNVITDSSGNRYKFRPASNTLGVAGIVTPANTSETVVVSYSMTSPYRVSSVANASGTTSYTTSDAGNVRTVTVTDSQSHVSTYVFDIPSQRLTSYTDPLGNITSYQHDTLGRYTQIARPEGDYTSITYDSRGNVVQQTAVAKAGSGLTNVTTTAGYDASCANAIKCNQPNWEKDALGNETDYTYDATSGLLTSVTAPPDPSGTRPQARYTYSTLQAYYLNGSGSIVASGQNIYKLANVSSCRTQSAASLTGAPGQGPFTLSGSAACVGTSDETKTTINYGPQSAGSANNLYPMSQTVAAGDNSVSATTSQTYDTLGNVVTSVGPLGAGQTTILYYDPSRRKIGAVLPDPDGSGSRTPAAIKFAYNADGALVQTQVGTVADQSVASWASFTEAYHTAVTLDSYDRPVRSATVSGSTNYAVADALYDTLGRVYCSIQYMDLSALPSGAATTCSPYQTTGSNGSDRVTQTQYDADSRILSVTEGVGSSAVSTISTNAFTPNGQIAYVIDGQNNRTTNIWDGFDRIFQVRYPSPTQGANSSNISDYEQLSYDALNRVTQKRLRDGGTISFAYDNLGRTSTRSENGSQTRSYTYDLAGRIASSQWAGGQSSEAFTYDALGQLTQRIEPYETMSYLYNAAGDRTRVTWGDGFYVNYAYDLTANVTAIQENGATSGIGLLATYDYDNLGRRTAVSYGNGTTRAYGWDPVSRLSGLQLSFPNATNNQLIGGLGGSGTPVVYNPSSQISAITRSNDNYAWLGAYNVDRLYSTNGLNQYTNSGGVSLSYDAKGNLTSSGATTFNYNTLNQLSGWTSGLYMEYGSLDELQGYGTTRFSYDGSNISAEYTFAVGQPSPIAHRYVYGPGTDEPIVWYVGSDTSQRRFLQSDERGSVTAITDTVGSIVNINSYDEFGIPASNNIGRFQFTGQPWFSEVGLYDYKARWYSPSLGRFMQTDPIGYSDGLNWYNYAHSDPVNGSDPSGLLDAHSAHITGEDSAVKSGGSGAVGDIVVNGQLFDLVGGNGTSSGTTESDPGGDIIVTARARPRERATLVPGVGKPISFKLPQSDPQDPCANSDAPGCTITVTGNRRPAMMTIAAGPPSYPRIENCIWASHECLAQPSVVTPRQRQDCHDLEKVCTTTSWLKRLRANDNGAPVTDEICVQGICVTIWPRGNVSTPYGQR